MIRLRPGLPPLTPVGATRPVPLTLSAGVINDAVRAAGLQGDPTAPAGSTWIGPAVTPINTQATPGVTPTTGLTKAGDAAATLTTPTDATAPFQALNTKVWLFDNSAGVGAATVEFDGTATAAAHTASVFALKIAGSPTISIAAASPTTISGTTAYVSYSSTATASSGDKLRITLPAGAIVRFTAVMLEVGSVRNPFTSVARGAGRAQVPWDAGLFTVTQGWCAQLWRMGLPSTVSPNGGSDPYGFMFGDASTDRLHYIWRAAGTTWQTRRVAANDGTNSITTSDTFAAGDYRLVIFDWNPATVGLSINGAAATTGANARIPTLTTKTIEIGSSGTVFGGSPDVTQMNADCVFTVFGNGRPTDSERSRLYNAFGKSTSPKPRLRDLIQLIPTAHSTFLWDGRTGTAQRRVAG